jgi:hypothetical protein
LALLLAGSAWLTTTQAAAQGDDKKPEPPAAPKPAATADEEAAAEEEAAVEEDESPSRPAPKGKGVVWGVVRSTQGNEALIEAQITVVGQKRRALTDVDGRYRLELAPGTYELRFFYELHKARRVQNLRVVEGQVQKLDVTLEPDKAAEEETTAVEAEVQRGSSAAQLMMRKNAAQVSDAVSAQDIARTPDRNAAEAARRVVGASIVDARYVYVRGLGERYTNSLLNGAPLPSTEPDRQAIPLDLFPSLVLSDVTIHKTFTPDMPADFVGGSVGIHTRDLPPKFQVQGTFALGFNTESTFSRRLSYEGGSLDWLGVDDGKRALPSDIPDERITRIRRDGTINPNIDQYARSLNSPMTTRRTTNLPNGTGSIVVGDTLRFGHDKEQALGYQIAASYTRRFTRRGDETIKTYTVDPTRPGELLLRNDYSAETGIDQVGWSGLGTLSYAPSINHKITLTTLYSRAADIETRSIFGFNEERAANISDVRLRFVARQLAYGQLRGEHKFPKTTTGTLGWNASISRAWLDEPDTRETIYGFDPTAGPVWLDATLSGSHFFARQRERTYGMGLDWTQPLVEGKVPQTIKFGGLAQTKHRYFEARRFRYTRSGNDPNVYSLPADQLFTDANMGTALALDEYTAANDAYTADHDVFAVYAMGDLSLAERLRLVLGERVEKSNQTIDSFDPLAPELTALRAQLDKTDLLPSASFVFKATDSMNVRLSATRTVARPQLRELAPFAFTDYFGAREIKGNPNLDRTRVINLDLRWEWFPGVGEVLAASAFVKAFDKPIEQIIIPTNQGVVSFQNAKSATNFGAELEARKGLGFVSKSVSDFAVVSNFTLVHSRVELASGAGQVQTNNVRPLAGQSPYIFNFAVDYLNEKSRTKARLLYNVFGARISQVGQLGLPDVYEQPRHQIDATITQGIGANLDLKLSVENLLNTPVRFTMGDSGDAIVNRYRVGTSFWLSATVTN